MNKNPEEYALDILKARKKEIYCIQDEYKLGSTEDKIKLISKLVKESAHTFRRNKRYDDVKDIHIEGVHVDYEKFKKLCEDIILICESLGLIVKLRDESIPSGFSSLSVGMFMNYNCSLNYTSHWDTIFEIEDKENILQI